MNATLDVFIKQSVVQAASVNVMDRENDRVNAMQCKYFCT